MSTAQKFIGRDLKIEVEGDDLARKYLESLECEFELHIATPCSPRLTPAEAIWDYAGTAGEFEDWCKSPRLSEWLNMFHPSNDPVRFIVEGRIITLRFEHAETT